MYSLRRGALDRAKSTTACIMSLRVACKIILVDFNLAVSTLTAKLPNLIPCQIFRLYGIPKRWVSALAERLGQGEVAGMTTHGGCCGWWYKSFG